MGEMVEQLNCHNVERSSKQQSNGEEEHLANGHAALNGEISGSSDGHAAVPPTENGKETQILNCPISKPESVQISMEKVAGNGVLPSIEKAERSAVAEVQIPAAEHRVNGEAEATPGEVKDAAEAGAQIKGSEQREVASQGADRNNAEAGGEAGDLKEESMEKSMKSKKDPEAKSIGEGGEPDSKEKGKRAKSRGPKDSRKDSRRDGSRSKASKEKDGKKSRRRSRSRSRHRRSSKHRSPGKFSPPRKRRARGSRSSSRSSSPSPRPRFSRGISPGAVPPRSRPIGGMRRSPPPHSRGAPPAGPWAYGGGPPYGSPGYGPPRPPRGGYSPPRRWPGPGRSPPPYGYERPYAPYGGPPRSGSRSPPPPPPGGQIYGRNPTTGSPLYAPPPAAGHGGPWERALPLEPRPPAQGKVWGARSGWDSVAPDPLARDAPPMTRSPGSGGPEASANRDVGGASRQGAEEAAMPATSRSSRGPVVGDSGWQNGPETTSKPRPREWSDSAPAAKAVPAMTAAEAELRAAVNSVDHDDSSWFYIDPQGQTQGPCSIRQFREWLRHMRRDPNLYEELKQFSDVSVWRVGMPFRVKLAVLMAIVVQTSPSPPPSPSSRTFSQHSALTPFPGRPMAGRHM